ncbi:hypothetical protein [Amycolatopsis sp. NPDC004169]|uniref:hypothetical protein n=1 Tax=Amycolatopsis sp. NPDC004169 TaxID=3154453 RepID=UPI0033AF9B38
MPVYRPDDYAPQAILDPYPHYANLRDLGPVGWLPEQKVHAGARRSAATAKTTPCSRTG